MTWGRTNSTQTWYAWPVYQGAQYDVPTSLLTQAKAAGFDYVRLTVDPGPFLAYTGTPLAALDQRLLDVVGQIRQAGLDVIVDFHPIGMIPSFTPPKIEWNVGGLFVAYVALVGNTAALLASQSDHVAIEGFTHPTRAIGPSETAAASRLPPETTTPVGRTHQSLLSGEITDARHHHRPPGGPDAARAVRGPDRQGLPGRLGRPGRHRGDDRRSAHPAPRRDGRLPGPAR
jgi:hypothetical protein